MFRDKALQKEVRNIDTHFFGSVTVSVTDYLLSLLIFISAILIIHCFFDDEVMLKKQNLFFYGCTTFVLEIIYFFSQDYLLGDAVGFIMYVSGGIYGALLVKEKRVRRFFSVMVMMLLVAMLGAMLTHVLMYCLGRSDLMIYEEKRDQRYTFFTLTNIPLILLVVLYLTNQYIKKGRTMMLRKVDKLYLMIYLAYMCIISKLFVWLETEKTTFAEEYGAVKLFTSLVAIGIAVLVPMFILRNRQTDYFNKLSEQQKSFLEAELAASKQFKEAQEETLAFRHDVQNNLSVVSQLMSEGKYKEAERFINDMHEHVSALSPKIVTGDEMLDSLIASKMAKMTDAGINFTIDGVADGGIGWKPMDICTVFANALDNAIEACQRVEERRRRFIKLEIRKTAHQRLITLVNSSAEDVDCEKLMHSKIHLTTKEDKQLHGYGVRNIRRTVEHYGGMLRMTCDDGEFKLEMIMGLGHAAG